MNALKEIADPVVMETHGGKGRIFWRCYAHIQRGIVFEAKPEKTEVLAKQRPVWAVYEGDCVKAIAAGVGAWLPVNFIDVDPYGEPWPVIDAIFSGKQNLQDRVAVVVNDGLRQELQMNGGWDVASMQGVVSRYGSGATFDNYLQICKELMQEKTAQLGYKLRRWTGYYCGHAGQMTHYAAVLERQ